MIPPAPFVKHPRSLMTKAPDCCLPPGYIVEGYEIEDRLGSGGFSNVYRARSLKSGRQVAIKEFLAKRAAGRSTSDESSSTNGGDTFRLDHSRGMFLQEARVLARLRKRHRGRRVRRAVCPSWSGAGCRCPKCCRVE